MSRVSDAYVAYGNSITPDILTLKYPHINTNANVLADCHSVVDVVVTAYNVFGYNGMRFMTSCVNPSNVVRTAVTSPVNIFKEFGRKLNYNEKNHRISKDGKTVCSAKTGHEVAKLVGDTFYRVDNRGNFVFSASFSKLFYAIADRAAFNQGFHSVGRLDVANMVSEHVDLKDNEQFKYTLTLNWGKGATEVK